MFSPVAQELYVYVCVSVVVKPASFVHVNVTLTLLVPVKFCVLEESPTIPVSGSVHVAVAIVWVESIVNVITGGVVSKSEFNISKLTSPTLPTSSLA